MKTIYVSHKSVAAAIDYFKKLSVSEHMHLGLFLFLKYFKITIDNAISDSVYKQDKIGLVVLYLLGGIFDDKESPDKRTCLFPFAFRDEIAKGNYYNGSTAFNSLLGRLKDTLDNTLIDHYINKTLRSDIKADAYSLKYDYLDTLESYLPSGKLDLNHLIAWIYRFTAIQIGDDINPSSADFPKDFTRILIKRFLHEFNITDEEETRLFKRTDNYIYSDVKPILGSALRSYFKFASSQEPEITKTPSIQEYMNHKILLKTTKEYIMVNENNLSLEDIRELLNHKNQVVFYGPPGTGKTLFAILVAKEYDYSEIIQFHPNYSYEDFIGGVKFSPKDGKEFASVCGILLKIAENAKGKKALLVIDEINRGNLPKIFGEAIITLDRRYSVKLSYNGELFSMPQNLHIIGTMNSADRNIALVDYALRRRFTFVRFNPNYEIIEATSEVKELDGIKPHLLLKAINNRLLENLKDKELLLGQSYFMPEWITVKEKLIWTKEALKEVFNYNVLPLLEEYTFGNDAVLAVIVGNELVKRIVDTETFIRELKKSFPDCVEQ